MCSEAFYNCIHIVLVFSSLKSHGANSVNRTYVLNTFNSNGTGLIWPRLDKLCQSDYQKFERHVG